MILSLFVVEHLFPQTISACSTICHYDNEMFAPFILLPTVGYRHLGVRIMGYMSRVSLSETKNQEVHVIISQQ